MTDQDDVREVLDRRPDLEGPLEETLAVDQRRDGWTFADVDVDSGRFGELVDVGIVERDGDAYTLADPDAVNGALGEADTERATETVVPDLPTFGGVLSAVDWSWVALVGCAVLLVVIVRMHTVEEIYRGGAVVLSGNDPYFYRYWVEQSLTVPGISEEIANGEPLFVWTLVSLTELFGGTTEIASHVLALYPVATGVACAAAVYYLAIAATDDRRIALLAVVFLAVIPANAIRTSVGFADHHALDYLLLSLTALAVTKLTTLEDETWTSPPTLVWIGVGGGLIGAQVLAWEAGAVLVAPVVLLVVARASLDIYTGISPLTAGVPVLASLAIGAGIVLAVHLVTGFHGTATALSPAILAGGAAGAVILAQAWHRVGWRVDRLIVTYVSIATIGVLFLWAADVSVWELLARRIGSLFQGGDVSETKSLLNLETLEIYTQFGLSLLIAVPVMVVGVVRSLTDHRWLPLTVYGWCFLALAIVQVRFGGELSMFVAIFSAVGFVWMAERLGALPRDAGSLSECRPTLPDRGVIFRAVVLLLILGGAGAVQSVERTELLPVSDRVYETATFVSDYADERGQEYPENYVLSDWSDNRVYNYYVGGEGDSYEYAYGNYRRFAGGTDPDSWYPEFAGEADREEWYPGYDGRVGYVVLATARNGVDQRSTIWRLTRNFGSTRGGVLGVGHFRVIYVHPAGGRTAVAVVPGATVSGTGPPNASVSVGTDVDAEGIDFRYERRTVVGDDGEWTVRVAQPGTYEVAVGNESTTVEVPEEAVEGGESVRVR